MLLRRRERRAIEERVEEEEKNWLSCIVLLEKVWE